MTAEQKLKNGANMNISEAGLSLIKKFEGCALESYLCPAGVWTIGYGHTKDVKEGDKINNEEADHLLLEEMPESLQKLIIKDKCTVCSSVLEVFRRKPA